MTSNPTLYGDTNHSGSLDILEKSEVGLMMWVYYFNEELKMKKPRGAKNWGL
jgi:hypothetical protein